jgi:hypothetical protein
MNKQQGGSHTPGTPLPWKAGRSGFNQAPCVVGLVHGEHRGRKTTGLPVTVAGDVRSKDDATYIVRACNAFPEMLEALEAAARKSDELADAVHEHPATVIAEALDSLAPPYEEN